jgi:hypothetical protein
MPGSWVGADAVSGGGKVGAAPAGAGGKVGAVGAVGETAAGAAALPAGQRALRGGISAPQLRQAEVIEFVLPH